MSAPMGPSINLGLFSIRTFTALLGGSVILALAGLVLSTPAGADRLRRLDVGLGALLGGVIGARLAHVLLNTAYFDDHLWEAFNLRAGGLNWHGAVFGGLIGLALTCHWRGVSFRAVGDVLAALWPLGALAVWTGCRASACAYGAEVWTLADFPAWAVSEQPDVFGVVVPRYNVQTFGQVAGGVLLTVMLLLTLAGGLRGFRLWLALGLTGAAGFALDFLRGDLSPSPLPGLTWDHVLDLSVIALAIIAAVGTALYGHYTAALIGTERD